MGTTADKPLPVMLSAMQPSNRLTLGNYLGALRNWTALQSQYECLFFAVDMHAITVRQDPERLREETFRVIATYIAGGIDPERATLFVQSHVPEHAELAWLLSCSASFGELRRMTQFRDKSEKQESVSVGLFTYPVLMAADILLYRTNLVPVGHDQKQHLELARNLAERFNNAFSTDAFIVPEPYIPEVAARIMSLRDPTSKMSKSDPDPNSAIYLDDTDKKMRKKIRAAVTDSGDSIGYDESKPGVRNLIEIQAALSGETPQQVVERYVGKQYGHLKVDTGDMVAETLGPIRDEIERIMGDRGELQRIVARGAQRARQRANVTLQAAFDAVGFVRRS